MTLNRAALEAIRFTESAVETSRGTVRIRELSSDDRTKYESKCLVRKGKDFDVNLKVVRSLLVGMSLIDPDTGARMYPPGEEEQVGRLPSAVVEQAFAAAQRLNGLTKQDVDELAGNSDSAPSDDSSSG